jgi:hypothetical protein
MKGKYIDATQDQPAIIKQVKTVEDDGLYVMDVKQLPSDREKIFRLPPPKMQYD